MHRHYRVSGMADTLEIKGAVEQSLKLGANGFFKRLLHLPNRRCVDFLRIAAGIYTVDRICKRSKRANNEAGARQLPLIFSVQDAEFWQQAEVRNLLLELLYPLTGDDWCLDFERAQRTAEDPGYQAFLLPRCDWAERVGLYSGGLDSAAGLANRMLKGADNYLLVTVDHRSGLHLRTTNHLKEMASILEGSGRAKPSYLHTTLNTTLVGGKSKRIAMQEKTQRSRAFMFCTAAAIAAVAYQVETVEMFENGVGAINLPLMSGMLGNALATNGAHPAFLNRMSKLATYVAERPVRFVLPFSDLTKADMVKNLTVSDGLVDWAKKSRSCIHTSIRVPGKTHCGHCPACIERRLAFNVAGIAEDRNAYQMDVFSEAIKQESDAIYFKLFQHDAQEWLQRKDKPRRRMKDHLRLTGIHEQEDDRIIELQCKHSREVISTFGPPFRRRVDTSIEHSIAIKR